MRKAPAAAAKPKPRARAKAKAKPKAKPSPDSLSAASSSPSGASDGSPSPVALGRGLPSASKPKPRGRARAKPKGKASPDSLSGASSPSGASAGSPSPVAVGRGFLSPASLLMPQAKSPLLSAAAISTPASVSTVGDLRGLAASSLDSLKRRLDALHADNAHDLEASHSRISKRIKMQTQSCVQMAEEAEKKMLDKYSHQADDIKGSYKKLMTDVQSSSSRVCKVTLPEMSKSVARAMDGLRSRYNIPATTA